MSHPYERELVEDLAARFQVDVERARIDLDQSPAIEHRRKEPRISKPISGLALLAILLAGAFGGKLLLGPGSSVDPTSPAIASGMTSEPRSTIAARTNAPAESVRLADGLPTKIDNVTVLRGEVALAAIRRSAQGDHLLIGGWLVGATPMSCPILRADEWWNPCRAVALRESPFNGPIMFMYRGDNPVPTPMAPAGQTGAIVFSVHTHDASCPTGNPCEALPVIDTVLWFGGFVPVPSSSGEAPVQGLTQEEAVEKARTYATAKSSGAVELLSATAAAYGWIRASGNEVSADHWVWAIVFSGRFSSPDCVNSACTAHPTIMIILDYADGRLIVEEIPA